MFDIKHYQTCLYRAWKENLSLRQERIKQIVMMVHRTIATLLGFIVNRYTFRVPTTSAEFIIITWVE